MTTTFIYEGIKHTGHSLQCAIEGNTLKYTLTGNGFVMVVDYTVPSHRVPTLSDDLLIDHINKTTIIENNALFLKAETTVTFMEGAVYDNTDLNSEENTVYLARPFTHVVTTPESITMQQFDRVVAVNMVNNQVEYILGNTGVALQVGMYYQTETATNEKSGKALVQLTASTLDDYLEEYSSFIDNFWYIHNDLINKKVLWGMDLGKLFYNRTVAQ